MGEVDVARFRRVADVEEAPLQGETILYHPKSKQFLVLNPAAAFVWERLGNPAGIEELAVQICDAFAAVEPETARRDVQGTLDQMVELGLVEPAGATRETRQDDED